jgi:hypothetical protein
MGTAIARLGKSHTHTHTHTHTYLSLLPPQLLPPQVPALGGDTWVLQLRDYMGIATARLGKSNTHTHGPASPAATRGKDMTPIATLNMGIATGQVTDTHTHTHTHTHLVLVQLLSQPVRRRGWLLQNKTQHGYCNARVSE